MSNTTPLSDAENRFVESRGQEVAPALSEGTLEPETPPADAGGASEGSEARPAEAAATAERDGRFVPLTALQEERAEKKQLREALEAFREWQAQLAVQAIQQTWFRNFISDDGNNVIYLRDDAEKSTGGTAGLI